jgi:hypothetical protein
MSVFPLSLPPLRRAAMAMALALGMMVPGLALVPGKAHAQEPTFVEQSRDWDVFTTTIDGAQACFIVSKPRSYDPMPESRHGDVFFYLTRRPAAGVTAEPLILVGYSFAEGSQVTTTVAGTSFTFLTQGPRAFLNDPAEGRQPPGCHAGGQRHARERDVLTRHERDLCVLALWRDRRHQPHGCRTARPKRHCSFANTSEPPLGLPGGGFCVMERGLLPA